MDLKKKDRIMLSAADRRAKQNTPGRNSAKTRNYVPATRVFRAASGKQVRPAH